jgi:hypothetical protein
MNFIFRIKANNLEPSKPILLPEEKEKLTVLVENSVAGGRTRFLQKENLAKQPCLWLKLDGRGTTGPKRQVVVMRWLGVGFMGRESGLKGGSLPGSRSLKNKSRCFCFNCLTVWPFWQAGGIVFGNGMN